LFDIFSHEGRDELIKQNRFFRRLSNLFPSSAFHCAQALSATELLAMDKRRWGRDESSRYAFEADSADRLVPTR
jgi:hypothetical protein